jgi:hypothetical protein
MYLYRLQIKWDYNIKMCVLRLWLSGSLKKLKGKWFYKDGNMRLTWNTDGSKRDERTGVRIHDSGTKLGLKFSP